MPVQTSTRNPNILKRYIFFDLATENQPKSSCSHYTESYRSLPSLFLFLTSSSSSSSSILELDPERRSPKMESLSCCILHLKVRPPVFFSPISSKSPVPSSPFHVIYWLEKIKMMAVIRQNKGGGKKKTDAYSVHLLT